MRNSSSRKLTEESGEKKIPKRMRINKLNNQTISTNVSTVTKQYFGICENPTERLSAILLDWAILTHSANRTMDTKVDLIPIAFTSIEKYLKTWEFHLLDEIKENIITNIPKFIHKAVTGNIRLSEASESINQILKINGAIKMNGASEGGYSI